MNRTCAYLEEIAEHLACFELAEPASVQVARNDSHNWVQLAVRGLGPVATELLAWADTFTVDALEVWRPRDGLGGGVHIDLYGHLPSFLSVRVYGCVDYSPDLFPDLQPGGRLPVSLTVLRRWADAEGGAVA
jgi:hypothetical protein